MTIIDFNTITPSHLKSIDVAPIDSPDVRREKENLQRYKRMELEYWQNIESQISTLTFHKKCHGVNFVRPSPNHRFIAVATYHGDVILYDALMQPWRPFRALSQPAKKDAPLLDISWSLDSTRISVITAAGVLQVLTVTGGPWDPSDARRIDLPQDDVGILPYKLKPLLQLDANLEDFIFQQGPLAEMEALDDLGLAPVQAIFFPSLSFLSVQNDMIVSMQNGDLLKCSIQNSLRQEEDEEENETTETAQIYMPTLITGEEAANMNIIGQNVEAELFRGHKKSILYMCFVQKLNALITVDEKGFINKWKYNIKYKSSLGWFTPSRKFKLETNKIMYKESGSDKPKLIFTDKTAPGKKPRTRQEIAAERRRVTNTLDNMQLGKPWHEDVEDDEITIQVFSPRGVISESGAMFHIVYRYTDSGLLSTYVTRLYKPVKVRCSRIVRVFGTPTSTELIIIMLFPAYPPKGPHFTIFMLDLMTMELKDFRKDLYIDHAAFTKMATRTLISCDMSRVFGPTGTEYMFLFYEGMLTCFSVTSGQVVAKLGPKKHVFAASMKHHNDDEEDEEEEEEEDDEEENESPFPGCVIDENALQDIPADAECSVVSFEGNMYCVVYARKLAKMYVIRFKDKNKYPERRAMWKVYTTLRNPRILPPELRVNSHHWELGDIQHPAAAARRFLLRKMDTVMRKNGSFRDHPRVIQQIRLSDKVENYRLIERMIATKHLLDKEGIHARRAPSRMSTATPVIDEDDKF